MDNPEVANLLDYILNRVANSQATIIINIYSYPPKPDIASVATTTDAEATSILGTPHKNKYGEVRQYIEERKRFDHEFKRYCETHSRVELCRRLTALFGWEVDDHRLGRNINRHLESKTSI